jgi:plasmid stabilization system protein ParE
MKVTWTEQAWERLLAIERFVARDDPRAAARLVDKLIDRGDALAAIDRHPGGFDSVSREWYRSQIDRLRHLSTSVGPDSRSG